MNDILEEFSVCMKNGETPGSVEAQNLEKMLRLSVKQSGFIAGNKIGTMTIELCSIVIAGKKARSIQFFMHNVHADAHLSHAHDYDFHYLQYVCEDAYARGCVHVYAPYHHDCVGEYGYAHVRVYVAIQ